MRGEPCGGSRFSDADTDEIVPFEHYIGAIIAT